MTRAVLLLAVLAASGRAALRYSGQATGFVAALYDSAVAGQAGLRYVPDLTLDVVPGWLDAEAAVNLTASAGARPDSLGLEATLKPYRAWLRLARERFEVRAGLQKLAFGSALVLRPLQWFDRLDPRDPTGATDGVYGLLGRYWLENNANLWAWGLVGNPEPKGWERVGSERWTPEFGGRAQLPVPRGEAALTYHHRTVDYSEVYRIPELLPRQFEDRLGLDGKLDIGIGLWVEATLARETRRMDDGEHTDPAWTDISVLGVDYTFGIGNGLSVLAEHLVLGYGPRPYGSDVRGQATALMVGYPLGLVDNLSAIALYDWQNSDVYGFVAWQRTLDRWLFQVAGFWGPKAPAVAGGLPGAAAGRGLRLTVVFNH
jgi:hypothetical protein